MPCLCLCSCLSILFTYENFKTIAYDWSSDDIGLCFYRVMNESPRILVNVTLCPLLAVVSKWS